MERLRSFSATSYGNRDVAKQGAFPWRLQRQRTTVNTCASRRPIANPAGLCENGCFLLSACVLSGSLTFFFLVLCRDQGLVFARWNPQTKGICETYIRNCLCRSYCPGRFLLRRR